MAVIKMESDFTSNFCQCCLSRGNFKKITILGTDDSSYQDMLISCFSIIIEKKTDEDCLICDSCISRLEESHRFRCQVEDSQIRLRIALNNSNEQKYSTSFQNQPEQVILQEVKIDYDEPESDAEASMASMASIASNSDIDIKEEHNEKCSGNVQRTSRRQAREKQKLEMETIEKIINSPRKYTKRKRIVIDKSRTCDVCGELFANYHAKRRHINVHYPNYVCDQCGKPFLKEICLIIHLRKHNTETSVCTTCGKTIKITNMKQHMNKHTSTKLPFSCPHCKLRFLKFHERLKHLETMHDIDVHTYVCKMCPNKYTTSSKLLRHVRRSHLLQINFYCDTCGKGFFEKQTLQDHIALHTGEKKHSCDICSKTFIKRWNMQLHRKGHFKNKIDAV